MATRGPCAVAAAVLLSLGAVLLPAAAGAHTSGHYFLKATRGIRFQVHGSHGYTITVDEASRGHFKVTVRGGPATTEYELHTSHRKPAPESQVRGSLGSLGTFDVHFTPRGASRQFPRYPWCSGPGPALQPGTVHGEIRFDGEKGYTRAIAHSAPAILETIPRQRCHYGELGHSKHPPRYTATLEAAHETGGPGTHLEAWRFAPGARPPARQVRFEASDYEQLGSIWVYRRIRVPATAASFLLPNFAVAPETAVIQPPTPFTGSAIFARTPESTFTWTGNLAVSFPGIDPLPLAGPDFRLRYCALHRCLEQESPEEDDDFGS